jgi:hypothetical protein
MLSNSDPNAFLRPVPRSQWKHSSCCELHLLGAGGAFESRTPRRQCCGCLDKGPGYLAGHCVQMPCSFGRLASVASGGELSAPLCGFGLAVGVVAGFGLMVSFPLLVGSKGLTWQAT